MEDAPVPSPAPWWRGPLASTLAIAAGALVALVLCQGYAAHQYGTGGVRPGSREYLLAQLANLVGFAVAIFLGTFVAARHRRTRPPPSGRRAGPPSLDHRIGGVDRPGQMRGWRRG